MSRELGKLGELGALETDKQLANSKQFFYESKLVKGRPVGYFTNVVKSLKLGISIRNGIVGEDGLQSPGTISSKSSSVTLTHWQP